MSYDDNHSTDRYWPSGRPLHECPLDAADPIDGTTTLYTIAGLPPIGIAISFALLTGAETLMIVGGYGWWVIPVALFVAAFCALFVGMLWVTGRDMLGIMAHATASPSTSRPGGRSRPKPPRPNVSGPIVLSDRVILPTTTDVPPDLDD
jgi:hypothetical protein